VAHHAGQLARIPRRTVRQEKVRLRTFLTQHTKPAFIFIGGAIMDTDTILGLLDERLRHQAFTSCLKRLENTSQLDVEALRVCIKLRPSRPPTSGEHNAAQPASGQTADGPIFFEQLCDLLVSRIRTEKLDLDHFYKLASIVFSDGTFAASFLEDRIYPALDALLPRLSIEAHKDAESSDEAEASLRDAINSATANLTLLKCSYWLPSNQNHVIGPETLQFLSQFLGVPAIDSVAHDAIAAFFSLLKRREPIVVATLNSANRPWLKVHQSSGKMVLSEPIINGSLWDQLSIVDMKAYASGESSMSRVRMLRNVGATSAPRAVFCHVAQSIRRSCAC
jgi:tRNA guanosine-2'-O-methyltransferase